MSVIVLPFVLGECASLRRVSTKKARREPKLVRGGLVQALVSRQALLDTEL
jgi:hypothetical protein